MKEQTFIMVGRYIIVHVPVHVLYCILCTCTCTCSSSPAGSHYGRTDIQYPGGARVQRVRREGVPRRSRWRTETWHINIHTPHSQSLLV